MTFLNDVRVGELRAAVVDGVNVQALFSQAVLQGQDAVSGRGAWPGCWLAVDKDQFWCGRDFPLGLLGSGLRSGR